MFTIFYFDDDIFEDTVKMRGMGFWFLNEKRAA